MPILEISVIPVGTGSASISSIVSEACRAVQNHNLQYQITPTATIVRGELDELLQVAGEMHRRALSSGVQRVITSCTIDDRLDRSVNLEQPVQAVTAEIDNPAHS